jgi:hypothetical protein
VRNAASVIFAKGSVINGTALLACDGTGTIIFDQGSTFRPIASGWAVRVRDGMMMMMRRRRRRRRRIGGWRQ